MSFLPIIKPDTETNSAREAERLYRQACTFALGDEAVAKVVQPYKTNGIVTGHKVLDDNEAVRNMEKQASGRAREMFAACDDIKPFRKTQLLNQALRREFAMDRAGKLSGEPSPSKLKRIERKSQSNQEQ